MGKGIEREEEGGRKDVGRGWQRGRVERRCERKEWQMERWGIWRCEWLRGGEGSVMGYKMHVVWEQDWEGRWEGKWQ